jgi:hypothetical protein
MPDNGEWTIRFINQHTLLLFPKSRGFLHGRPGHR